MSQETRTTVVPYLCITDAARAIDFYKQAFGAVEIMARITDATGRIGHAEIKVGDSVLYIADEHPEYGFRSPQSLGGAHVQFAVNVPDMNAMVTRAGARGRSASHAPSRRDQFLGPHRRDHGPFGYRWTLSTHVEDVSDEEMQRRWAVEEKKRKAAAGAR